MMIGILPRSLPIRWRLALLNVSVLIATIVALSGLFLLQLDNALIGIAAENLREQARPTLAFQERRSPTSGENENRGEFPPPPSLTRAATFMVRGLSGPDTGVAVYDASAAEIASSETVETNANVEEWPDPETQILVNSLNGSEVRTVVRQQTRRTLVLLLPIRSPDGTISGVLQLSRSLDLVQQLEDRIRLALLLW